MHVLFYSTLFVVSVDYVINSVLVVTQTSGLKARVLMDCFNLPLETRRVAFGWRYTIARNDLLRTTVQYSLLFCSKIFMLQ